MQVLRFPRADLPAFAELARGGYIITPDGDLIAVDKYGHEETFPAAFDGSREHEVLRHGAIRVSFCTGVEFAANWHKDAVTVAALQTLRVVLAHHEDRGSYTLEEAAYDDDGDCDYRNDLYHSPATIKEARAVIAAAIRRRMPAKAAA